MDDLIRSFFAFIQPKNKFQILSDLHLEIDDQYATFNIPPCAPNLVLAGDTGRLIDYNQYLTFLRRQRFEKILLVLGSHEFHGLTYEEGLQRASDLESAIPNLTVMHRKRVDLPGCVILGCTLFSHIPAKGTDEIASQIPDFSLIQNWSVAKHNTAHEEDIAWLRSQLATIRANDARHQRHLLFVTHFAPTTQDTVHPDDKDTLLQAASASDLLGEGGDFPDVDAWVFGRTHHSVDFVTRGIRVVSNQRGFVSKKRESVLQRVTGIVTGRRGEDDWFDVRKVITL